MSVIKAYTDSSVELSVTEQALLLRLFLTNNKAGWAEWFGATNRRLLLETDIKSEKTLISARNGLRQKGFIDFVPGKKGQPTNYSLLPVLNTVIDTVKNTGNNTVKTRNTVIDTVKTTVKTTVNPTVKTTDIIDTKVSMTNRLETRDEKKRASPSKKSAPKTKYAEAVSMTNDEHSSLMEKLGSEQAVTWCIQKLNNYKLSSGKRYKSDYRAILNWVIDEYYSRIGKTVTETKSSGIDWSKYDG